MHNAHHALIDDSTARAHIAGPLSSAALGAQLRDVAARRVHDVSVVLAPRASAATRQAHGSIDHEGLPAVLMARAQPPVEAALLGRLELPDRDAMGKGPLVVL
jgi:hypothetical protein